jgi:LacI family transcriptional regulator
VITIKNVADRAKVSITTVSHVVNGTRRVSEKSRQRVLHAIHDLKYVPSAVARSLKINRTHTLGLIVSNNTNPFFAEVARGVEDGCYEAHFNVILCNSDDDPAKHDRYVRVLSEKQVDGLLLLSSGSASDMPGPLDALSVPHLEVDREIEDRGADMVQVDHFLGGTLAAEHLLSLGHRRIACIVGPGSLVPAQRRLAGYKAALHAAGVNVSDAWIKESDFTASGGHRAMVELLSMPLRPTAVFATNDLMALGAICAASQAGLSVPRDISIVGFDDIALAAYTTPPLTTVAQPMHELGRLAAKVLIDRVEERDRPGRREILDPSMRIRQSTTVPRSAA